MKDKEKKERPTWVGYHTRKTKTRREKELSAERKHKRDYLKEEE